MNDPQEGVTEMSAEVWRPPIPDLPNDANAQATPTSNAGHAMPIGCEHCDGLEAVILDLFVRTCALRWFVVYIRQ